MATMKTLNGFGFDSAKLGGRAPEYYTNPRNLLYNSNFTNPVNRRGQTTYNAGGYTIDGWSIWSVNGDASLTLVEGGIAFNPGTGSGTFTQKLPLGLLDSAKTYTLAVHKSNGETQVKTDGVAFNHNGNGDLVTISTVQETIVWAALYEGFYTADNVPPPFFYSQRLEMLNLGLPVQPRNLLDNSDFTHPVNQRGATSYSGAVYTIDKWRTWLTDDSVAVNDGYITVTGNGIHQYFEADIFNDAIYTFAAKKTDGTIVVYARNSKDDFAVNGNLGFGYETSSGKVTVKLCQGSYVWAALYEGSYTAETLPPYVPKGKHVEMLNCGVSLAPHNLLDNSDFTNPVNQRGATSYSGNFIYLIDRWIVAEGPSGSVSVQVEDGGITFTTSNGGLVYLIQRFEKGFLDTSKDYTIVAYMNDGSSLITGYIDRSNGSYDAVNITFQSGSKIKWVALYEDSYTADTLPPYVPKGYTAEFAECRRYYKRFTAPYAGIAGTGYVTGSAKYIYINPPDNYPMRINKPSFAFKGVINVRGINGYIVEDYGDAVIRVYENATGCIPTLEISRGDSAAWNVTNNTPVAVQFHANSVLELKADL